MRYAIASLCAIGGTLACACAWGQGANPAFANPATPGMETGKPEGDVLNAADQGFLRAAAIGNRAEADLGKLANDKATNAAVKDFGRRMAADHGTSLESVQRLARTSGTPLSREPDLDHRVVMQQMQEAEPGAFDLAYIRAQVAEHQRTATLLIYQIGAGQSEQVRNFSKETLVHVMDHLAAAKAIHAELTGAAP
jgi:putative membrane protein